MNRLAIAFVGSVCVIILVYLFFGGLEQYILGTLESYRKSKLTFTVLSILILSSDCILPIPSSVMMYLNGTVLGLSIGFGVSFVSVNVSSYLAYYLGRISTKGWRANSTRESISLAVTRFGSTAIIISRGIPILSESISFTCGFKRYRFKEFAALNAIAFVPICFLYTYIGFIGSTSHVFLLMFFLSCFVALTFYFLSSVLIKRKLGQFE